MTTNNADQEKPSQEATTVSRAQRRVVWMYRSEKGFSEGSQDHRTGHQSNQGNWSMIEM